MRARRLLAAFVAAAALAALTPASASAGDQDLFLAADAAVDRGYITLFVTGSSYADASVGEQVDGAVQPVASLNLGDYNGFGGVVLDRALQWRCDRLTRNFVATSRDPDGTEDTAAFSVRTPSCRDRLSVTVPRAARPGGRIMVVVRDTWKIGGVRGRLCTTAPRGSARCRTLNIPAGTAQVTREFRPRLVGRWRVEVRAPDQRITQLVSVGVKDGRRGPSEARPTILATGDSLIQSIDALLTDRLGRGTQLKSDSHAGSGISKSLIFDWRRQARRQVSKFRPDATVIAIGSNDGFPMKTAGGTTVECCDEPWVEEYARRVRAMMKTYAQGGKGEVFWLTVPAPRDERRRPAAAAVNAAVLRAAEGASNSHVVRLDTIFTPGGVYRDVMRYRGRPVRVREGDGIHLSVPGAAIATSQIIRHLKRFGPL